MPQYPMTFVHQANSQGSSVNNWTSTSAEGRTMECSVPKEFDGPGTGFSPEDLYIAALANCYVATFSVIASNSKIEFSSLVVDGELTLEVHPETKKPWMSRALLKVQIETSQDLERVQRFANRIQAQCLILNSVKTEVGVEVVVRSAVQ